MATALLNTLYGRPLPKLFLKAYRIFTGFAILGFPLLLPLIPLDFSQKLQFTGLAALPVNYAAVCLAFGGIVFPLITLKRHFRKRSPAILKEETEAFDLGAELGEARLGDGKHQWLAKLRLNGAFRLAVTKRTLRVRWLPEKLEGTTVLMLSDFHFHGTPSKAWFEAVLEKCAELPTPDVVALVGDFVDSIEHRAWIQPLLSRLKWNSVGLAILGNHDIHYGPDAVRTELELLGYTVLGNRWKMVEVRGVPVIAIGHEGPWFDSAPELSEAPKAGFRLGLSHTPDYFDWAADNMIDLLLCGHTHGGAIRVPLIGPIFIPCRTGRRYDTGVFEKYRTAMVVGRGLSGREPIRINCDPQVIYLTLTAG